MLWGFFALILVLSLDAVAAAGELVFGVGSHAGKCVFGIGQINGGQYFRKWSVAVEPFQLRYWEDGI